MRKKVLFSILALAMVIAMMFMLVACNGALREHNSEFNMPVGAKPELPSRVSSEDKATIDAALTEEATAEQRIAAVMALYNIANTGRMEPNTSLMIQESIMGLRIAGVNMDTTFDDMTARVLMHGFTLKDGEEFFNQFNANVAYVAGGLDIGFLFDSMGSMMLKQSYRDADGNLYFCINKTDQTNTDCSEPRFPYARYDKIVTPEQMDYDTWMDKTNTLDGPCEIYNMKFVPEIIADNATVSYDSEKGIYSVKFEVNMDADPQLIKEWYALPQKDMQEGGQNIERYLYYRADFEVWDTGHVKSYHAIYARSAGMGSGITEDTYSYLYDKEEILDIISDDYRLTDEQAEEMKEQGDLKAYLTFYETEKAVAAGMSRMTIIIIVAACVVGVIVILIILLVVLRALYKRGKLPKLQARIEAKREAKYQALRDKYGNGGVEVVMDDDDYEDYTI